MKRTEGPERGVKKRCLQGCNVTESYNEEKREPIGSRMSPVNGPLP